MKIIVCRSDKHKAQYKVNYYGWKIVVHEGFTC